MLNINSLPNWIDSNLKVLKEKQRQEFEVSRIKMDVLIAELFAEKK